MGIKNGTTPLVEIWNEFDEITREMAYEAIRNGIKAIIHESNEEIKAQKENGVGCNGYMSAYYKGCRHGAVHTASNVLWKLFECCPADCIEAIEKMAASEIWVYGCIEPVLNAFAAEMTKEIGYLKKRATF